MSIADTIKKAVKDKDERKKLLDQAKTKAHELKGKAEQQVKEKKEKLSKKDDTPVAD